MSGGHDHGAGEIKHEKPLWIALLLTGTFLIAEVVGGLITNSLALLSDAAHMGTDVLALGISLFAVRLSRRPADAKKTYGYARMEAIGALINGGMLFLVAGYILWEAFGRFQKSTEVASVGMLVIATLGLVINLISMRLLAAGSGESLNVKGAYLEVWADMLGSLGVIAGAVIIYFTGWTIIDPIVAVLIGLWVLPRTWRLMSQAVHMLMQGVPEGLELATVDGALREIKGVRELHNLHIWALGSTQTVLTTHLVYDETEIDAEALRQEATRMLRDRFDVHQSTIQIESSACIN
ncbi:cation diffusion facilitator family transporter [Luteimonas sp. FXH3W]|mgnify:CR=1 FL=1|uniref:Cation diffusion facilitator family transporter n=1 Tax=Aquilutibacter rugosus TaxID=3115820 RepID=A0ABU7UWT1_9GAMM